MQDRTRLVRAARRKMVELALGGFSLQYLMAGHYSPSGVFWTPDTVVRVTDQRNDLNSKFYITEVSRRFSIAEGHTTLLSLWPVDLWLGDNDNPLYSDLQFYGMVAPKIFW